MPKLKINSKKRLERKFMRISDLKFADYNPRTITDKARKGLAASIHEFGLVQEIVVNRRNMQVVGGHQRLSVLREQGEEDVPVVMVDLDPEKEKALNVALNNPGISGEFDLEKLDLVLESIDDHLKNSLNFDELPLINSGKSELADPDDVPEPPADPRTKPGDLYQLENHRLLCGDSTKAEDIERLMGGELADMVFTDPPYGVGYIGKTKDALEIENDNLDDDGLRTLITNVFNLADTFMRPGAYALATVPARPLHIHFASDWKNRGWLRQIMVWVKDSMVLGHSEYHYRHEPILFGWKPGERFKSSDRKKTTVWEFDRPKASREHPTMKPVEMWIYGLGNHTKPRDIVYDPFGGSGTTLIACEKISRKCRIMEIDPAYCDVIVKRWEDFTGKKARKD